MLINDSVYYEDNHYIIINNIANNIFYYIDYDKRDYSINMEFQHLHPYYEVMLLLAPNATHLIEGTPYNIHMGDMVLLAPSVMHKSVYYKGEPSKRVIIDFMYPLDKPETAEAYKEILKPFHTEVPILRLELEDRQRLIDILNDLFSFSKNHDYYGNAADEFYIHNKFQEFLYGLYELSGKNIYTNDQAYNSIEQKMYEISSFIHANYKDDISLASLSERFFISPSYLSREFKQVTGFNISNYIQLTRIKNAQYRLVSTNDKISAIASDCGFASFSQFNRIFNRISGSSPREYRQSAVLNK
ncbi:MULTISPECIES: helix-turn-helix domain-containing protein [unclassified Butyrivibrio]|uniref:helix-turn-helix domain-containing protein n=1 Tax=unclassified Butyrivibrio TaxID=2639466 RepID=UPI0003B64088|nr:MULTISPECIES: AraC family transcriptional regulator [unclassified Butyrivibrio]MDC7292417.1 AraC family transcriptional regulator [Butyrivibrio sp. DSM 10294]